MAGPDWRPILLLLIDQSDQPEPKALADWRQQAASAVPPAALNTPRKTSMLRWAAGIWISSPERPR